MRLIIALLIFLNSHFLFAFNDSIKRSFYRPISNISIGINNRICDARSGNMQLRYINVSSHESDTFNYEDIHKTSSNLLTINMGISGIYDFVGAKFDIGFIPFANRNYNLVDP